MTASRQLRRRSANAARLAIILFFLILLFGPSANAQTSRCTKKKQQLSVSPAASVPATASEPLLPPAGARGHGEGEVRRIDKNAGKITIRHGDITGLGMPPMLMVFRVQDPAVLSELKTGDRITFIAGVINGMLTVVSYELAK
jgi:Cu/Ag efflux protein CusF